VPNNTVSLCSFKFVPYLIVCSKFLRLREFYIQYCTDWYISGLFTLRSWVISTDPIRTVQIIIFPHNESLRLLAILLCVRLDAAQFSAPAGTRPAIRRPGAASILPGGRIIAPHGQVHATGPGAFGVAISPNRRTVVTANGGTDRYSLTVLEREKTGPWQIRHLVAPKRNHNEPEGKDEWRSVFMGVAFSGEHTVWVSDGNSGRVRLMDLGTSSSRKVIDLNQDGAADSYTGDLALDQERSLLYVLDQANFRLVIVDLKRSRIASSTRLGRLPFALALSPDKRRAYVTNLGMFEYKPIPGADPQALRDTALPFPAFGFPSQEARDGARRQSGRGPVDVPGLGDPNVRESNSLCVINVDNPAAPKIEAWVRTGLPFGGEVFGGSGPAGVVAAGERVFVSNSHADSITVVDAKTNAVTGEIPIRIPGLEKLRGVLPIGMAYHEDTGWLLVAEAGINAIGVIDTKQQKAIGHLPAAWFPSRVRIANDNVYVTNARGFGEGANAGRFPENEFIGTLRTGALSIFPVPDAATVAKQTALVLQANGFQPKPGDPAPLPAAVRYVVLIVKENRTFDEVFGDIVQASNGAVMGIPALARFGHHGYASGGSNRLSLKRVNVTPNHHAMAARWAFSDNFYADSDVSVDGHHWLAGSPPDAWTQTSLMAAYGGQKDFRFPTTAPGRLLFAQSNSSVHPEEQLEAGTLWHHLERHGIPFRNFGEGFELAGNQEEPGERPTGARFVTNVPMPDPLYRNTARQYPGFNMNIPDKFRAAQFIQEVDARYAKGGEPFPRFIFIHLPNDHMADARPADGYPYRPSFVADNDYALGRIIEYLSHTPQWREMAVFVTEDDAQGGVDHIDAHRTVLLAIGPYCRRNYASHTNASFPGLLKTIFRLLALPPLNLFDAAASDLGDVFMDKPDFSGYEVLPEDPRLFDPAQAKEPMDPKPSPKMDDPREVRK
jgi:YVTN family beta-propeller protein